MCKQHYHKHLCLRLFYDKCLLIWLLTLMTYNCITTCNVSMQLQLTALQIHSFLTSTTTTTIMVIIISEVIRKDCSVSSFPAYFHQHSTFPLHDFQALWSLQHPFLNYAFTLELYTWGHKKIIIIIIIIIIYQLIGLAGEVEHVIEIERSVETGIVLTITTVTNIQLSQ